MKMNETTIYETDEKREQRLFIKSKVRTLEVDSVQKIQE